MIWTRMSYVNENELFLCLTQDASEVLMWGLTFRDGMSTKENLSHMHIQRCKYMLTCTQKQKTYYKHTYIKIWSRHWRLGPCCGGGEGKGGKGEARLYGSSECGGVDGQITRDTWSTRTRKRCFQVWLYWRSTLTLTQWWKKRAKRGRRWDENIATVVRKWRTRRQSGGEKWLWMANPVRRIYKRQEATWWIHMNIAWFEHRRTAEWMVWRGTVQEDTVQLMTPYGLAWSTVGDAASSKEVKSS